MPMVNIALGSRHDKTVAVVDMEEGGASVAIVSCPHDGLSTIIATGRSAFTLDARTPAQAKGLVAQQIQEAGRQALKIYGEEGHRAPVSAAYAIVHAPWTKTQIVQTQTRFEGETRIHDAMIGALASDALTAAKEIDRSNLFEASVARIKLNGYPTTAPEGKYAHHVDLTSLVSECDAAVKDAADSAMRALFPVASIVWRSSLRALVTLLRASPFGERNYLAIDMGADSTHLVSMRGGVFEQRIVPEGVRTILARIASGRLPDEILGNLRMLSRDACSTEACEAVEKSLAGVEPELVRIFGEAMGQMAAARRIANDVLLVTHPDLEAWLSRLFSRIDFAQFTITTLPIETRAPSYVGIDTWVTGEMPSTSLAIGAALITIEARA